MQTGTTALFSPKDYLSSVWSDVMQNRPVAKLDKLVQGVEGEARMCANVPAVNGVSLVLLGSTD